jgi:hypothetical protein
MLNKQPDQEREKLRFKEAVLSSFKFLDEFGFHAVEEKVTFIRFESPEVFVNVFHGRRSYELGIEIGRLKEPKERLTIGTIIPWAGAEKTEGFGQHVMFQVSSREGVQEFVPKLAKLVEKYTIPLLRGDNDAFRSAFEFQAKKWVEYESEVNLRDVRAKAETAWQAKDYARVAELYKSIRNYLTEIEVKRLMYSNQQIVSAQGS